MGARMTMFEKTPPKPRNASVSAQEVGSIESSPSAILTPRSYFEDEEINYRSCTWAKTAMLMFATYIGPAVMTFPSAMSEMGIFAGVLLTLVNAGFYSYTSMVLWRFCVKNKDMKDISDIARKVAGRIGYVITSVMFVWHCICIMGLHLVTGSEYLNTVIKSGTIPCGTMVYAALLGVLCWALSCIRTMSMLSKAGLLASSLAFVALLLVPSFLGSQAGPIWRDSANPEIEIISMLGDPIWSFWSRPGATWVTISAASMSISFNFVGQVMTPSFIAEMRSPEDFPKALALCTTCQTIFFLIIGLSVYCLTGQQYMTAPAFGGLYKEYQIIVFSLLFVSVVVGGAIYCKVIGTYLFQFIFSRDSKHVISHTLQGWSAWVGLVLVLWVGAFIVAQAIPMFSSLIAFIGAVFDGYLGFMLWGWVFFYMRRQRLKQKGVPKSTRKVCEDRMLVILNCCIIFVGIVGFWGLGAPAAGLDIRAKLRTQDGPGVFSCRSNMLAL